MQERLVIRNFGPIKSVDLNLGRMTILIGEQATGKSTIAKVLAVCRYFSYIVNFSTKYYNEFSNNEQFYDGLKAWELDDYLYENSEIVYENEIYKFEFNNELIIEEENVVDGGSPYVKEFFETHTKIESNSIEFQKLLKDLENLKENERKTNPHFDEEFFFWKWNPNENYFRLNVKKVMNNPTYIPTERVLQSISFNKDLLISEAVQEELRKINRIIRGYNKEVSIEPLSIVFRNDHGLSYIKKNNEKSYFQLSSGASGFQSTIPTILTVNYYTEIEKRSRTFIIEEPEINLFPKAQKKLVEFFAESMNNFNHQFLLPTHSPYILSSLNNLMYAYKVANEFNAKKEVQKIIHENHWINPDNVEVYFLENGEARSLIDKKEGLINIEELDSVSNIINDEFNQLLSIEINNTKSDKND